MVLHHLRLAPPPRPAYQIGMIEDQLVELDAFGLLCPLPVLKARKRLQGLPAGARLRVLADDPAAAVDIPHFCAEAGHALVSQERLEGGGRAFVIRKGG